MVQKLKNLKQKILKFQWVQYLLETVDNMKKTGFTGYVFDFSVDYDPITVNNIKDILKYLMEKSNIV